MRTLKAQLISKENFSLYGTFSNMLEPKGNHLGSFYHDGVLFPVSGNMPLAFSTLVSDKQEPMVITSAEYHNYTGEGVLPLDDDVVIHVAPPSNKPVPDLTEAFIVPKGTFVFLNAGVWHLAALPVHKDTVHILIALPERTYFNDCTVVEYAPEDQFEIQI